MTILSLTGAVEGRRKARNKKKRKRNNKGSVRQCHATELKAHLPSVSTLRIASRYVRELNIPDVSSQTSQADENDSKLAERLLGYFISLFFRR